MFKELLSHNQIGGKVEISYILFDVLRTDVIKDIAYIKIQCLHYSYSFGNCFNGTVILLRALELIIVENETVFRNPIIGVYDENSLFDSGFFFEKVIKLLDDNEQFTEFFNSNTVKFNLDKKTFYLRDSHLPIKHSTIKKILINTGLLVKDQNVRSIFYINDLYLEFFKMVVIKKIQLSISSSKQKRQFSLDRLKEQLKHQEVLGLQAENFVFSYEKRRLFKHPMISEITRVSDEYSNAGYDIESFNDTETIFINRFIEVKSYTGDVSFFWSNNEIQTAKDKEDQYFIYLVNREEMERPGYHPLIISNPYKSVYNNPEWIREVGQYKFYTKLYEVEIS